MQRVNGPHRRPPPRESHVYIINFRLVLCFCWAFLTFLFNTKKLIFLLLKYRTNRSRPAAQETSELKPTAVAARAPDSATGGAADPGTNLFTPNSIRLVKTKLLAIGILSCCVDCLSSSAGPRPQIKFEAGWQRSAIEISVLGVQNWFLDPLALGFRASVRPGNCT